MTDPPLWRRAFDQIEPPASHLVQSAARSSGFALVLSETLRVQRGVARRLRGTSAGLWHLLNLPAHSDLLAQNQRLARLEAEVRRQRTGEPR